MLHAFFGGQAQGLAMAEAILGDFNPAGRLPLSFPVSADVLPSYYDRKPSARRGGYRDPPVIPGGLYPPSPDAADDSILWAFGHGLSYDAAFDYGALDVTPTTIPLDGAATVSFDVTNNGTRAAEEVPMLFYELARLRAERFQTRRERCRRTKRRQQTRRVASKMAVLEPRASPQRKCKKDVNYNEDAAEDDVCKPKPAKRRRGSSLTQAQVEADCAEGDAYVASVLGEGEGRLGAVAGAGLLFCIISKSRWTNVKPMEAWLLGGGLAADRILWVVGRGEAEEYERAGAKGRVLEGGGLCNSRNRALDEARAAGVACVQLSDDLKKCEVIRAGASLAHFHDEELWEKPENLKKANAAGGDKLQATPVAACALLLALLRATGRRLAGCYPNANPGLAAGVPPVGAHHFIVGDCLVVDVQRTQLRFDERITLKEDYDYTAQHMHEHGAVCRSNRVLCLWEHYSNPGGAVDARCDEREQHSIALLKHKWPGAFRQHGTRGPNEVQFAWDQRDVSLGGKKTHVRPPPPKGIDETPIERKPKDGQKTMTSFFKKK